MNNGVELRKLNVTVILCTYNRCVSLGRALGSIAASELPPTIEWEVLVVDNNSRDQTCAVVARFSEQHPGRFRYVFEPRQGKSHALNTGIREARGDVLAFVDDDVTVESTWLRNLTAGLQDCKWVGAGGRVVPLWTSTPPKWLLTSDQKSLAPLVAFDLGDEAGPMSESPFGTNMAFRREVVEKFGGFRTDLGPRPGSQIRGEDTEFGRRLLEAGERLLYEPSAVVYHPVPSERLSQGYFLEWWFDKGRADIREFGVEVHAKYFLGPVPVYLLRRFAVWTVRWMLSSDPARRFDCKRKVWGITGQIIECKRLRRNPAQSQSSCSG